MRLSIGVFVNSYGRLRSGWASFFFVLAFHVVLYILFFPVAVILIASQGGLPENFAQSAMPTALEVATPFLALVAAIIVTALAAVAEEKPFRSFGLHFDGHWFKQAGLGTLFGGGLILASAVLLHFFEGVDWSINPAFNTMDLLFGFILFSAVAVNEELVFRGYPFQRLVGGVGAWKAQLVFALFFGIVHLGNPGISKETANVRWITVINIALSAILLGQCYLSTRSLALPIGVHLGWNWVQGNLLGFSVSGTSPAKGLLSPILGQKPQWLTGGQVGLEGSIFCTVVTLVAILGFRALHFSRTAKDDSGAL